MFTGVNVLRGTFYMVRASGIVRLSLIRFELTTAGNSYRRGGASGANRWRRANDGGKRGSGRKRLKFTNIIVNFQFTVTVFPTRTHGNVRVSNKYLVRGMNMYGFGEKVTFGFVGVARRLDDQLVALNNVLLRYLRNSLLRSLQSVLICQTEWNNL